MNPDMRRERQIRPGLRADHTFLPILAVHLLSCPSLVQSSFDTFLFFLVNNVTMNVELCANR